MEFLTQYSPDQVAIIVGVSLVAMFILSIINQFMIFEKIIVKGDASATIRNIESSGSMFWVSVLGWLIVYALDAIIALGLYVMFRSTSMGLLTISAILRLLYTGVVLISLIALVMRKPAIYDTGQLVGYAFFIAHLFTLGYLVYSSSITPGWLGILLIIDSISYVVLTYGEYFIPKSILDPLSNISMIPAALGELIFAIWILLRTNKFL